MWEASEALEPLLSPLASWPDGRREGSGGGGERVLLRMGRAGGAFFVAVETVLTTDEMEEEQVFERCGRAGGFDF